MPCGQEGLIIIILQLSLFENEVKLVLKFGKTRLGLRDLQVYQGCVEPANFLRVVGCGSHREIEANIDSMVHVKERLEASGYYVPESYL